MGILKISGERQAGRFDAASILRRNARVRGPAAITGEDGYILLAVLIMVVMVLIVLSIAAPKVAADIQRDREVELMHRGMQYRRAIQLYYRKFNAYPPNMEALEKVGQIRFLRKRYIDPVTGKDEWHLIHFGENKTPTAMGFFGQAMGGVGGAGGSTLAGTGPGGVGQSIGGSAGTSGGGFSGSGGGFGGTGGFGGGSGLGGSGGFGGSSGGNGNGFGAPSVGSNGFSSGTNGGTTGTTGTDPNSTGGTSGSTSGSSTSGFGSTTGGSGQTFGGGGIIGVESTSPKATILEYKKKKHFNEWEFVYDPMSERMQIGNSGSIGQPAGTVGNGGASSNTPSIFQQQPGTAGGSGTPGNSGSTGSGSTPQ